MGVFLYKGEDATRRDIEEALANSLEYYVDGKKVDKIEVVQFPDTQVGQSSKIEFEIKNTLSIPISDIIFDSKDPDVKVISHPTKLNSLQKGEFTP